MFLNAPYLVIYLRYDIISIIIRKTITNQKTFLITKTGTLMVEAAYEELALPFMTCPLTNTPFKKSDVLELVSAASAFAASGEVIATIHTHTIN